MKVKSNMKITRKYLSLLSMLMLTLASVMPVQASVWDAENTWDNEWEERYREWVQENWKENFFMNEATPLYYKLSHDCADAVYLMRLVFSYEHQLPFVINNAHEKGDISNTMNKWNRLSGDKRVRKFMDYVADMTSTKTLKNDSYPIALGDIKPGDLYVSPGVHSYQIINITNTGIAEVMSSTTPKAPRPLARYESFPFYVPEDSKNMSDGYRRFKQPQNIHKHMTKQPGFSNEQYKVADKVEQNYVGFTDIISEKLRDTLKQELIVAEESGNVEKVKELKELGPIRPETSAEKSLRLIVALCEYANDRSAYVYEAQYHLLEMKKKGRSCMTKTEYDNFSTPGRDKRLTQFFGAVHHHIDESYQKDKTSHAQRWAAAIFSEKKPDPRDIKELNKFCKVEFSLKREKEGEDWGNITLRNLRINSEAGKLVSDPNAPLNFRWGIPRLDKREYKAKCPTY